MKKEHCQLTCKHTASLSICLSSDLTKEELKDYLQTQINLFLEMQKKHSFLNSVSDVKDIEMDTVEFSEGEHGEEIEEIELNISYDIHCPILAEIYNGEVYDYTEKAEKSVDIFEQEFLSLLLPGEWDICEESLEIDEIEEPELCIH